jgi:hypothetical protein
MRSIQNTQIYSVGKMQNLLLLHVTVHTMMAKIYKANYPSNSTDNTVTIDVDQFRISAQGPLSLCRTP